MKFFRICKENHVRDLEHELYQLKRSRDVCKQEKDELVVEKVRIIAAYYRKSSSKPPGPSMQKLIWIGAYSKRGRISKFSIFFNG